MWRVELNYRLGLAELAAMSLHDAGLRLMMLMPGGSGSRRDDVTGGDNLGRSDCAGHGLPRFKFHQFHLTVVFRFSLLSSCRPSPGHNESTVRGSWSDSGCLQGPLGRARQTRLLAGEPMSNSGAHQKF